MPGRSTKRTTGVRRNGRSSCQLLKVEERTKSVRTFTSVLVRGNAKISARTEEERGPSSAVVVAAPQRIPLETRGRYHLTGTFKSLNNNLRPPPRHKLPLKSFASEFTSPGPLSSFHYLRSITTAIVLPRRPPSTPHAPPNGRRRMVSPSGIGDRGFVLGILAGNSTKARQSSPLNPTEGVLHSDDGRWVALEFHVCRPPEMHGGIGSSPVGCQFTFTAYALKTNRLTGLLRSFPPLFVRSLWSPLNRTDYNLLKQQPSQCRTTAARPLLVVYAMVARKVALLPSSPGPEAEKEAG
ncbi:hypothetical protein BIW11_02404 [Tropilaelaps mercedesae]|uniref:Uncharacterized protein n=1 Tax=Tropilaelaps mercedesae TaxID=418985 RepID=A0A1V9Y400_9ACAR|nr:hypothetical protein BIW11_02404 [Tropilaelaps mercedesae]